MNPGDPILLRLQNSYATMCNGDWEHTYGVAITNIDNPGSSLKVELIDSYLYDVPFAEMKIERAEDDSVICKVADGVFKRTAASTIADSHNPDSVKWSPPFHRRAGPQ